jgi:hypothetical protein
LIFHNIAYKFETMTFFFLFVCVLQVFLGHDGVRDVEGNELPRLVYVSREKRPGFDHHKKAGAMNSLVSFKLPIFWFRFILMMIYWLSITCFCNIFVGTSGSNYHKRTLYSEC